MSSGRDTLLLNKTSSTGLLTKNNDVPAGSVSLAELVITLDMDLLVVTLLESDESNQRTGDL